MRRTERKKVLAKNITKLSFKITTFLTKRFILRTIALLIYFSSITVFGYIVFNPEKGIIKPLLAGIIMILTTIFLLNIYYKDLKKTFRSLALITLIPLLIFIFLNIKYTSNYVNTTDKLIESTIENTSNIPIIKNNATKPIENTVKKTLLLSYENFKLLIPKLKLTAIIYFILFLIFFILSLKENPLKKIKYKKRHNKKKL